MENPTLDPTVMEIEAFLVRVAQIDLLAFNLVGAEFNTQNNVVNYRLKYEVIGENIVQIISVERIGANSYRVIDSKYSQDVSRGSFVSVDSQNIFENTWVHKVNQIIMKKYGNLLGMQPSILSIEENPPLYKIVYESGTTTFTFLILYDFLLNRIIEGNITIVGGGETASVTRITSTIDSVNSVDSGSFGTSSTNSGSSQSSTSSGSSVSSQSSSSSSQSSGTRSSGTSQSSRSQTSGSSGSSTKSQTSSSRQTGQTSSSNQKIALTT